MSAVRRLSAVFLLIAIITGCAHGSSVTNPATPVGGATQAVTPGGGTAKGESSTVSVVSAPSVEDARALALKWVASTGELLKMGPIGRSELLRRQVASGSTETMIEKLSSDLTKPADGLPIPATELRLMETPLTIDVTIDTVTGQARAEVWSVVVFGAKDLGAPRVVFRTSQLVMVVEAGEWKLASFTAAEGPTPIATD